MSFTNRMLCMRPWYSSDRNCLQLQAAGEGGRERLAPQAGFSDAAASGRREDKLGEEEVTSGAEVTVYTLKTPDAWRPEEASQVRNTCFCPPSFITQELASSPHPQWVNHPPIPSTSPAHVSIAPTISTKPSHSHKRACP